MKFIFTCLFFIGVFSCVNAQTYTWNKPTLADFWTTASNWTPSRNVPSVKDTLIFDGTITPTAIPRNVQTETIGRLWIKNNADVTLGVEANNTLTIGSSGVPGPNLQVDAGTYMRLNSSQNVLTINIAPGFSAQIAGNVVFTNSTATANATLNAFTPGAIVFQKGSTFTTGANFSGNPFGTATASENSVVFQNGSTYIHINGSNPFGLTAPASIVVFQKGSLYSYRNNTIFSASGRTYANFEVDLPSASNNLTITTGNSPMRCDTLTFKTGTSFNMNMPGGMVISGDIRNQTSSGTLSFAPSAANAATILLDGSVTQNIIGNVSFSPSAGNGNTTLAIASSTSVNLQTNLALIDSVNVHGKLYMNNQTVSGNVFNMFPDNTVYAAASGTATKDLNTISNITAPQNFRAGVKVNITGGGFPANTYVMKVVGTTVHLSQFATASGAVTLTPVYNAATLGIGSVNGITAPPAATGNVLTTKRNFQQRGYYEYTGNVPQSTGLGLPSTVKGLILNKSAAVDIALSNPVTITEKLSLQKGFLVSSSIILPSLLDTTVILSPANLYGYSNEGYEQSFIKGAVTIDASQGASRTAPIGKNSRFAPARITKVNAGTVTYSFEYFDTYYTDTTTDTLPLDHVSRLEYWSIATNTSGPSVAANVALSWRPSSKVGNGNPANDAQALNDLVVAHYFDDGAGLKWLVDGPDNSVMPKSPGANVSYGMVTTNIPTGLFTIFTLGTKSIYNILPVNIIRFTAVASFNKNKVSWMAENDDHTKSYELQHSTDGISFTPASEVPGKKLFRSEYAVEETAALNSWNYYRLKITDEKNKISYSHIIKIHNSSKDNFAIYPNPATESINITLPAGSSNNQISIVNSAGRTILSLNTALQYNVINVAQLPCGVYYLKLKNNSGTTTQSFVKQ